MEIDKGGAKMKWLLRPICWLKIIPNSLMSNLFWQYGYPVSGHEFVQIGGMIDEYDLKNHKPILKCSVCGYVSK